MSEPDLEEQKKAVLPFLQRAQEMQTADPKVAYYCRMYSVEQAFKFEKRAKEINGLVGAALAQMEKEKPKLGLDKENDRFHCEALALKVFGNAEKVDRAGRSDLGTAKTFLAASYFLEILNHFGPLDADLLEKQKYAAWRAAEIRKAVRDGRPALPPSSATVQAPDEFPAAYSGGSSATLETLPAAYTDSSSFISSLPAAGSAMSQPWAAASAEPLLPSPPTAPVPAAFSASAAMHSSATGPMPDQRFKPGSRLLYLAPGSQQPEAGTVGQVLPGPDGWRYNLALRDRLEVVCDDGQQLAPSLSEGDAVTYRGGRGGPTRAHVLLVQDMSWPPSYMMRLDDGSEVTAEASQLSLLEGAQQPAAAPYPYPEIQAPPHDYPQPPPLYPSAQPLPPPSQQPRSLPPPHASQASCPPRQPPPVQPPPVHPPPLQTPAPSLPPGHKPSVQAIMDAQKNAKYAVSSLNFEDVPAAVKYLQTALRLLTTAT